MTIFYLCLIVLCAHYNFPDIIVILCSIGISWETSKAIGKAIKRLNDE